MDKPQRIKISIGMGLASEYYDAEYVDSYIDHLMNGVKCEDGECPICGQPMIQRVFRPPTNVKVFGLSLVKINEAIGFARQHGWEPK